MDVDRWKRSFLENGDVTVNKTASLVRFPICANPYPSPTQLLVSAHAHIKDSSVLSRLVWTTENDSNTQRVTADTFENGKKSPFQINK